MFAKWGIDSVADSGVLVVGEKRAFYSSDDYCGKYELKGVEKVTVDFEKAEDKGGRSATLRVMNARLGHSAPGLGN